MADPGHEEAAGTIRRVLFDRLLPLGIKRRTSVGTTVVVVTLSIGFGVSMSMAWVTGDSLLDTFLPIVFGSLLLFLLPIILVAMVRWGISWRAWSRLDDDEKSLVRAMRRLPRGRRPRRMAPDRCQAVIDAARVLEPGASAIAGARAFKALSAIPIPEGLPEPEPLADGGITRFNWRTGLSILCGLVVLASLPPAFALARSGEPLGYGCFGLAMLSLVGLVVQSPWAVRWIRRLKRQSAATFAGPGVVVSRHGRWTRDDSVLVAHHPLDGLHLEATLVGPAGILRLRFDQRADTDLVNFWQRWAHSEVRPDLAEILRSRLDTGL